MREVIALAQTHRDRGIEAHATAVLASAHARLGEADEARRTIARALELGPASGSIIKEADVHIVAAAVFYDLGEVALGIEHGTRGARLAHSVNGIECACAGYALTGLGNLHAERPGIAIDDFATALQLGGDTDMALLLNQIQAWKAIAHFHEGDPDALSRIRTTLENARRLGDDFGAAFIGRSLADLLIRAGDLESARPLLDDALAYYRQRGLRPYVARTLESLAEMHEREGRADDAAADRRLALDALTAPLALLASDQQHAHGEAGDPGR
jgi:tetratricopeptide (TPR) repeat protein